MDHNPEAIIDAEEELYRRDRRANNDGVTKSSQSGEYAAQVAGVPAPQRQADEVTPLLSNGNAERRNAEDQDEEDWPGRGDFDHLPKWKRPSVYWMLPPFLLWTLAIGGTILPKTNLIINIMCRDYLQSLVATNPEYVGIPIDFGGGKNEQCNVPSVDKMAAKFTLICGLISGILAAFTSPKLGALSDRYGRKVIIAGTTVGMLLAEIITIIAATYPDTFDINWILLGFALDGLAGSFIAGLAISHSYAADCTKPSRRNVAFGYFHGCLFTGMGAGPVIFGFLAKAVHSLLIIFYLGLACHLIFVVCLVFVIPESLSKRRQIAAREKYALRTGKISVQDSSILRRGVQHVVSFFAPLTILWPTGEGSTPALRRNLIILAAIDTISFGVAMGVLSIIVIYTKSTFDWDVAQQATYMSSTNLVRVSCLLFVLPAVTRLVRGPEKKSKGNSIVGCDSLDLSVIRISIMLETIGFFGYTFARSGAVFVVAGAITAIGGIGAPSLQSSLTKHIPVHRTGEMLGAGGLLHALARVIAPIVFSSIFIKTADHFRQTVFLCLAVTFAVAAVLSWFIRPHVHATDTAFGDRAVTLEAEIQ